MNRRSLAVLVGCALVPTFIWTQAAAPERMGGRTEGSGTSRRENTGMIFVARRACVVGSSAEERVELGKRYGCAAAWLADDLNRQRVELPGFWIDRCPVTNAQYLAFVEATGARRPWPGGTFPRERADHPVVGVNGREAVAYARWAGKRLPSAEEWEVAARPAQPGLYPWGATWPGPVPPASRRKAPRWDLPGTRPIGTGRCGRSAAGMEDLSGQVCEWTATTMTHHGVPFHMLKGASWFHEDPVSYRTAAGSWVMEGFYTPLIGFRCAMDGDRTPPTVARKLPSDAPSGADFASPYQEFHPGDPHVYRVSEAPASLERHLLSWSRLFIEGDRATPRSRGFVLSAPFLGPWPICLFYAESMHWNDQQLLAGYNPSQPALQRQPSSPGSPTYRLDFDRVTVQTQLSSGTDFVDLVSTITNKTDIPSRYVSGSCISLTSHPYFYDCELLRTYQLTASGDFVSLRQLPRRGPCVHWIAGSDLSQHGGEPSQGVMAVLSRDHRWTLASVRVEETDGFNVIGNPWLSCLHTDAPVRVPPGSPRVIRQRLYLIRGGLNDLKRRIRRDVEQGIFRSSTG
jgi:sulfatase modifying factor 1